MGVASHFGAAGRWLLRARGGAAAIANTVATRVLLAGINLGTGIITARVLGATGRGEQSAMTLWPALIPYLLSLGIPTAALFCMKREPARRSEFYTVAILAATTMSVVSCAVGVVFIPLWLHEYSADVIHGAQLSMVFAPQVMLNLVLTAMLNSLGDFKLANSTRLVATVATLFALLLMAAGHVMTPFLSAVAYLAPPTFIALWLAWKLREYFSFAAIDPRPALKILGSYGIRSYGVDIMATLSAQVDQVLVVGVLSANAMGVYAVALNASRVLQILDSAVVTVVFPSASGLEQDRVVEMVARAARISTILATAFGAALIVMLPFLISLFYGRGFEGAVPVGQLLTLEAILGGLTYVLSQAFMASGRPGLVTGFQTLGFFIALPCMFILMPHLGLMGAAISLLIATVARLAFVLLSFPLIMRVPIPNLIPSVDDLSTFRRAIARRT